MINMVAVTQIVIIVLSRGDIYLLGEAYAFGVLWSLVFKTLSMIILRFKPDLPREWMFPVNIKVGKVHFPVGMCVSFVFLLTAALTNLMTKKVATVSGVAFTIVFFTLFQVSEHMNRKKSRLYAQDEEAEEKPNLRREADIAAILPELTKSRKILVPVRNPNNLVHLKSVLETADDETTDIIVLAAKISKGIQLEGDSGEITPEEKDLFSNDPFYSIAQVAQAAAVEEIVMGVSGTIGAEVQLERLALAWGQLQKPEAQPRPVTAKVVWDGRLLSYKLS
jgi:hypothetical protein